MEKDMVRTYDDSMFIDTFEHEYTYLNGFLRNVRRFSKKIALIDPDLNRSWTYSELNDEANLLANALLSAKIARGDVVMSVLRNSPEFAFSYCGVRKIGAVLLTANFNLSPCELSLLIDFNKPRVLIYSAPFSKTILDALSRSSHKVEFLILADNLESLPPSKNHILYEDFVKNSCKTEPKIDFRHHIYDEVLRLCTSGTTSLPKCVPINDINEVLSAHDVIMHYPMDLHDVTMNMTPWFHRGGCHSGGICPAFYVGAAVVIMRNFRPQSTLDWVSRYKITFLMGAPANLSLLARVQEQKKRDLSPLRGIVTMGAPLSRTDCVRFMEILTPNIFNGYGTTETFWNSFLRPCDLPNGAGTVGASCTDDEVRVVQIFDSRRANPDEVVPNDGKSLGEIIVKSPEKTTYTYIGDEKNAKEKFFAGFMYTGDTGTWDENFVVTVRGRKDDMMVVSGENIYPEQIEEAINSCSRVKDSLVTSVPDRVRGQAVAAYVVPLDDALTIREIAEFCEKSPLLSRYKKPRYFALVDSIPFTATGKKKRAQIRDRAQSDLKNGILRKE